MTKIAEDDGEPPPSAEDLKRAFDEADYDGGGTIDSGEFLKLMMLIKGSGGGGDGGGQEAQDSKSKGRFGFWKRRLRSRSSAAKGEKKEKTEQAKKTKQGRKKKFNTISSGTADGESKGSDVASDEDTKTAPSFSARRRTNTQDVEDMKQKSKKEPKAVVAKRKKPLPLKKRAKLRAVFEAMDDDHSGSIDLDELKVSTTSF